MQTHPSSKSLYKRVRLLTNLGEHHEAQALFEDLQASSGDVLVKCSDPLLPLGITRKNLSHCGASR